ncbi:unnamed protein product [Effrenium voratum]|nr:unnamed protein product [Effrenium voratum]|eukprot:CAMPEP_0181431658 /NCGR_PEP_ID=MMETSP1110-20121109/18365_1 /TAXON_ID=174948 /ORGANISM="Symbiodinium sp., Strain CCMP421" /LENGTH=524 /DNA_ID=CAMNT_0023555037 /DNA_START=42 /DNA_END=1616 /DNA_ORIENTATION=+
MAAANFPTLEEDVRDMRDMRDIRVSSPMGSPVNCSGEKAMEGAVKSTRRITKIVGLALFGVIFLFSFFGWPSNVIEGEAIHGQILAVLFLTGILLVALEDVLRLDKSAVMLVLASVMWTYHAAACHPTQSAEGHEKLNSELVKGLSDVGSVILFLLPAMGIVESIDHMQGFAVVTSFIIRSTKEKSGRLMPIICILAFFLSSIIDNLTATIVCIKILQKVVPHNKDWRHSCGGLVVVAANAGGAWSPIGDVTTTMLWIQGKISTAGTVVWLFLPSFVAGVVPLFGIWWQAKRYGTSEKSPEIEAPVASWNSKMVLLVGVSCILMVPIVKMVTGLPPYLGMMMALGVFWLVSEIADLAAEEADEETGNVAAIAAHGKHGVPAALHFVDLSSLLFFTGVLLGVAALESADVLAQYSEWLESITKGSDILLAALIGVSSAVVDNVPLVQASIEMFHEPMDDPLWQLVALSAGTGGSMLAVGSVAGVTLMGLEKVSFLWYAKRISPWAALGFALGLGTYQLQRLMAPA